MRFSRISARPVRVVASAVLAATLAGGALCGAATGTAPVAHAQSAQPALSSTWIDELGRPTPHTVQQVHAFADRPYVPAQVANALRTAVDFYAGSGEVGGPPLPTNAAPFTQFYWPTVSSNCMGPGLHSTASAIAVPGPAAIPAPGAGPGQATFVFTALGTPPAAADQGLMKVYWINLHNFRTGVTPLGNHGINPVGPATLSGTATTGPGNVLAVVSGSVRTADNTCGFAPTAATFSVR